MCAQAKRRPKRVPLSSEEVAHIVQLKKRKAHIQLLQLKKSWSYKAQNIFNMFCFFIYWELILCFFGPCTYQLHFAEYVTPEYGFKYNVSGEPIISELKIKDVNGVEYKLIVDEFIKIPSRFTKFLVAKDFLLRKNLRARIEEDTREYRLFSASPILLLSLLVLIISLMVFTYDLNHNAHSLMALTVLNCLVMLAILSF